MEEFASEAFQVIEIDPLKWEQLFDALSTSITVNTMNFIAICVVAGVLLGQILWRWMK